MRLLDGVVALMRLQIFLSYMIGLLIGIGLMRKLSIIVREQVE
jgi:hypothetical protein